MYCLTNRTAANESGPSFSRSQGGLIQIYRPKVIGDYNENMGGVDLAGMRRLHCNSTVMGLHRWWLKFFLFAWRWNFSCPGTLQ